MPRGGDEMGLGNTQTPGQQLGQLTPVQQPTPAAPVAQQAPPPGHVPDTIGHQATDNVLAIRSGRFGRPTFVQTEWRYLNIGDRYRPQGKGIADNYTYVVRSNTLGCLEQTQATRQQQLAQHGTGTNAGGGGSVTQAIRNIAVAAVSLTAAVALGAVLLILAGIMPLNQNIVPGAPANNGVTADQARSITDVAITEGLKPLNETLDAVNSTLTDIQADFEGANATLTDYGDRIGGLEEQVKNLSAVPAITEDKARELITDAIRDNPPAATMHPNDPPPGCPDSDQDCVPDEVDKCPDEIEDWNGEGDGCPEPAAPTQRPTRTPLPTPYSPPPTDDNGGDWDTGSMPDLPVDLSHGDWTIQATANIDDDPIVREWLEKLRDPAPARWKTFPNIPNKDVPGFRVVNGDQVPWGAEYGVDNVPFCQQDMRCDFIVPGWHYRLITADFTFQGMHCSGGDGCLLLLINVGENSQAWRNQMADNGFTVAGRFWDGGQLQWAAWGLVSHAAANMLNMPTEGLMGEVLNSGNPGNAGGNCGTVNGCETVRAHVVVHADDRILALATATIWRP